MKAIVILLLLAGSAVAAERPEDFAYGMPIQVDGRDALYEFEIPASVYAGATRSDLGDMRIFNGQGEVVPHALRPRPAPQMASGTPVTLPVFPFYSEPSEKVGALNVRVDRDRNGAIISVHDQSQTGATERRLRGYLLDASALKEPVQALRFDWQSGTEGYVGRVRIEASDDLSTWRILANQAALVRLNFEGNRLQRDRVEFPPAKHKYLRVSWREKPLEALSVRAEPAANVVTVPRSWRKISGQATGKAGEYAFDISGPFPVDRLRIELPEPNSVAQLQILTRAKSSDDWRPVARAAAYRLRDGDTEVASPDIEVNAAGERHWLLRIDQKGGGVGSGVPALQIGWIAPTLVFAARGNGPFQLVYGSRTAKAAGYPIESLIPGYKTETEFKARPASLGEPIMLGGPASLRERIDYKQWTLWAILIVGVALLGLMAYRLSRQVAKSPSENRTN